MKSFVNIFLWVPRILCILAILFISLFAADSFAPGLSIWQQLAAFLVHLIPTFILAALLFVAWKWEFLGGILFMIIGLATSPLIFFHNYEMNQSLSMSLGIIMAINLPFIVVGVLFIISYYMKKKYLV